MKLIKRLDRIDCYHGGEKVAKIEMSRVNYLESIYVFNRKKGFGRMAVKSLFEKIKCDLIDFTVTESSRRFWTKIGAIKIKHDEYYLLKQNLK